MLKKLSIRGFKSLTDTSIVFPRLAVLFGPNDSGKSNLLDAVRVLSRIGTFRTLSDALAEPIRGGHPIEAFSFPAGGLRELLRLPLASLSLEADLKAVKGSYRYRIEIAIEPSSGRLSIADEYLARLGAGGDPKDRPTIERVGSHLHVNRGKFDNTLYEHVGRNHAILSDRSFGGAGYRALQSTREELSGWRIYYPDQRVAMRADRPPSSDVQDIGVLGGEIAPFLYRLRAEHPKHFQAIARTLRSLVPSVWNLTVDFDDRRGTLDVIVRQFGIDYSSRVVSDGTLRVLALCAVAVNPWAGSLLAFEEPENGVHPSRLELLARLLAFIALEEGRQVIVTTHSPLLCDAVLKIARSHPRKIGIFNVQRDGAATVVKPFNVKGSLFKDSEIAAALTTGTEDGLFESLMLRGLLDA